MLQRDVKVAGFSEEDQANLWQNVTDAQSKAKRGVGQGSALGAVAGARWAGRKTKIGDSDEEDGPQEGEGLGLPEVMPCCTLFGNEQGLQCLLLE